MEELSKELLLKQSLKIAQFADNNLAQLRGLCQEKEIVQDYFLGILRRQAIILYDIHVLLDQSKHNTYTSISILCRCLLDDFIHLLYLDRNNNFDEDIVNLNADQLKHSFKAVDILLQSNKKHFGEDYPYYINEEQFENLKKAFAERSENEVYFTDRENFKFKKFKTLTDLASEIDDFELSKMSQRAFFYWKDLSESVHYSNATMEKEFLLDQSLKEKFAEIEEVFLYGYNNIILAFRYFSNRYQIDLIEDEELKDRFIINGL